MGASTPVSPVDPPRRRRRRCWPPVLIALLALLAVLVVADRVAPGIVADAVAVRLQQRLHTPDRPDVRITGVPFLTQLAAGRYRHVTVRAADVPVDAPGGGLTLHRLSVDLSDVQPLRGASSARVGRLTGTATVAYPQLSNVVGQTVSYAGTSRGRGRIRLGVHVVGSDLATLSGIPQLQQGGRRLRLVDPRIALAGRQLPTSLVQALVGRYFHPGLPALPAGLRLTGVRATSAGILLTGGGTDVVLGG